MFPFHEICRGPHRVICLPGLDGSRTLIERIAPHIDGEATLLWADYNRVRGLTYPRAVAMLEQAVEANRPRAILAESFGSTVAIAWALEHAHRDTPLVLTGPMAWTRRRWCTGWGRFAAWLVPEPLQPLCVRVGGKFVISRRGGLSVHRKVIGDFSRIPRQAWLDRLAMLLEVDLRARLADLRVPMTLMWGEEDRVVWSQREAEQFRAAGHGDAIRMVPKAGHSLWTEVPDVVADEIRRLLNGVTPTQGESR